jgi:hypothetical protein
MPSCTAPNPTHDFMLVDPLCCNDDRAGEIGPTFHFMIRHDLVLANDKTFRSWKRCRNARYFTRASTVGRRRLD